ncbi:hypothetical protein [Granulicella sp. L60]|jgi:hypothetical protein|uniref:hypothetical protein n=1 Tax=Granulicella sp. L60 TaxID=1641866 RepID=UPI00131E8BD9|nr:hypothetical protein [Granulicella sp. L60]
MQIRDCRLMNEAGDLDRFVTQEYADWLVARGGAKKLTRKLKLKRYQLTMSTKASESRLSPTSLTVSDMESLAGVRDMSRRLEDRLEGYADRSIH